MLTNITPTTELDALNVVLSCQGEAPVDSLTADRPDVVTALAILRETARTVQSGNWRFNSQFGYRLTPAGTHNWDGTTLNIFVPPASALRVEPRATTPTGAFDPVNVVLRQAERFTTGNPAVKPMVLFDLDTGRDGFPQTGEGARSELFVDVVWAFDFVGLPEAVRYYITILAARRFAQRILGDANRSGYTQRDESAAYREVVRSQRPVGHARLLTDAELLGAVGGRPLTRPFDLNL